MKIETFSVTSRGQAIVVNAADFSDDIWARLAVHGATQKIADAASGAARVAAQDALGDAGDDALRAWMKDPANADAIAAQTIADMGKAYDALKRGEWGTRGASAGVDERTRVERMVARIALKTAWGAKSPKWAEFTGRDDDAQAKALDKVYADNAAKLKKEVDAEIARRAEARERKAALGAGLAIDL